MNGQESYFKSWVIKLIILNVIVFFIQMLLEYYQVFYTISRGDILVKNSAPFMTFYLGLTPALVIEKLFIWQIFTYMFLHGGFLHLFLNMYALLIFGMPVEEVWGSKRFLIYYFVTGVGAGICIFTINLMLGEGSYNIPTIGASGAVFGLLLAFGMLYPDAEILIFFFIPMKAKYLVVVYGAIELYSLISSGGQSPVSHVGHLGGLLTGIIYFLFTRKSGIKFKSKIIKSRLEKELSGKVPEDRFKSSGSAISLISILEKVKIQGPSSITDDEYQYLKYKQIMSGDVDGMCIDADFDQDDQYCRNCENIDACLLREIKKYTL
ncbi:MAG: rhomboid family intramembrane serine protease [Spirochaetes bacterium]|jgi:membrane associated rhomboid family serine protease|nr:rhomboid family intramembrane serine protease [Spirochaetota bacterium]